MLAFRAVVQNHIAPSGVIQTNYISFLFKNRFTAYISCKSVLFYPDQDTSRRAAMSRQ
jgi:hypothetical protein